MATKTLLSFREFLAEPEYVIVQLPAELLSEAALLNEGKWMPSGRSGWMQRLDAANPAIPTQRHVHVAREKHTSSKTQQAAWNADGTRHDKKIFNDKVGALDAARTIARTALNLGDDVMLEQLKKAPRLLLLTESQVYQDAPVEAIALKVVNEAG
jgi:uncharacterized protein (DUF1800 family)